MAAGASQRKRGERSATQISKREQRRLERSRRQRTRRLGLAALAVVTLGGLAAVAIRAILVPPPGEYVVSMGNSHIAEAQMGQFTYNSYPPTSGPHLGSLASWGVHDEPIPDELQVHNLEDGGVIIHYDCPQDCPELVDQLRAVVERYHEGVILEPYPNMDSRIALNAWQRIDRLDQFDEERITGFIRAYRGDDHHR